MAAQGKAKAGHRTKGAQTGSDDDSGAKRVPRPRQRQRQRQKGTPRQAACSNPQSP